MELTVPRLGDDEIVLRPPARGDIDAITEACQDPEIPRWTRVPSPYTRAHATDFVERSARTWKQGTDAAFVIVDAESGRLLGAIGVHRFDDHERRVGALLPRARRTLDELDRVGARVRRRDAGPARDLGILARLGDRLDVAGHGRTQRDLVIAEAGDGQVHPARVSERRDAGLRITAAP